MEFLKIDENKLKITLTPEELSQWGLDAEDLDCADLHSRSFLRKLLRRAEHEVGFFTEKYRTLVQLYASKDGGCEVFVSRITPLDSDSEEEMTSTSKESEPHHEDALFAFSFDKLEWLLAVCRRLRNMGYCGHSRAYRGTEGRYYLILEGIKPLCSFELCEYSFICEFGSAESPQAIGQILREYGHLLCKDDAVEQLGVL